MSALASGLYDWFRAGSGLALLFAGLGELLVPAVDRGRRSMGLIYLSTGALFSLSALDPHLPLPLDLGNLLILGLILVLSQALLSLALFLLGDEEGSAFRRKAFLAGIAWAAALFGLGLLDYALGLEPVMRNVEDGRNLGPFHAFVSYAMYAWPVAACVLAAAGSRWKAGGASSSPEVRRLGRAAALIGLILGGIGLSFVLPGPTAYRIGQASLQAFLLGWYLLSRARPDYLSRAREAIVTEQAHGLRLAEAEAESIRRRLERVLRDGRLVEDPELDLAGLAAAIGLPGYRLSNYLNDRLGQSFPAWINGLRIELVKRRLLEEPERGILEIALDSGYNSKAVFNEQFRKLVGASPSEYRRKACEGQDRAAPPEAATTAT